jgi:hypothetical protein
LFYDIALEKPSVYADLCAKLHTLPEFYYGKNVTYNYSTLLIIPQIVALEYSAHTSPKVTFKSELCNRILSNIQSTSTTSTHHAQGYLYIVTSNSHFFSFRARVRIIQKEISR